MGLSWRQFIGLGQAYQDFVDQFAKFREQVRALVEADEVPSLRLVENNVEVLRISFAGNDYLIRPRLEIAGDGRRMGLLVCYAAGEPGAAAVVEKNRLVLDGGGNLGLVGARWEWAWSVTMDAKEALVELLTGTSPAL